MRTEVKTYKTMIVCQTWSDGQLDGDRKIAELKVRLSDDGEAALNRLAKLSAIPIRKGRKHAYRSANVGPQGRGFHGAAYVAGLGWRDTAQALSVWATMVAQTKEALEVWRQSQTTVEQPVTQRAEGSVSVGADPEATPTARGIFDDEIVEDSTAEVASGRKAHNSAQLVPKGTENLSLKGAVDHCFGNGTTLREGMTFATARSILIGAGFPTGVVKRGPAGLHARCERYLANTATEATTEATAAEKPKIMLPMGTSAEVIKMMITAFPDRDVVLS